MRLSLGDSPEILRITESSPSSAESSFRELDDVFLQTQTRIWLGEVLHTRFDEETTIADLLADGELLFQVSKVVWKMLRTKCVETIYSEVFVNEPTSSGKSGGRYMPYSNVDSFLKVCKIIGLTGVDLFSPSDVVEKRDTRRVCMCIRSLSKKARSKRLKIPDFDVVTYTIAMPTDLVGFIRRSLEQSQCSSSKFVICSKCLHSKRKYKQKIQEMDCIGKLYLSSEGSDDAEFQALEFPSPAQNASYDATSLSGFFGENSPGQVSVVEENFNTPENRSRLDVQNQNDDAARTNQCEAVSFTESDRPPSSCSITHDNHTFPTENAITSSRPCLECQIDLNLTPSPTHWRWVPENGNMHDADLDHCRTSFVWGSTNELDELFHVDSKETLIGGVHCNKSMLWQKNYRSCSPKLMPSDSYVSSDDMQEKFTNASLGPSDIGLHANHILNGVHIAESKIEAHNVSSLNSLSCTGATLYSKDHFNVKDDTTGCHLYFHKFQNLGKSEKCDSTLEVSDADEAKLDELSRKCRDLDCEFASRYVENQLDGILTGKFDSPCNGFIYNDIPKRSMVTNGNDGHGVSAECMPSHNIYPTHVCTFAMVNSKDTRELFDASSADKKNALALVSESDAIATKHWNYPSMSVSCFTDTEIGHEAENTAPETVAVGHAKTSLHITLSGLWHDNVSHGNDTHYRRENSEATSEEEQKMSAKQKESCNANEMCKVMREVVKPFCSDRLTENKADTYSENRQGELLSESRVSKKSSTDSEEDKYMTFVHARESDVPHEKSLASTSKVTNGESLLEMKGATISHSFIYLSNDLPLGKWHNQNSFSEYKEMPQADVNVSESRAMPAIDGYAGRSTSEAERNRIDIEGVQLLADLNKTCLDTLKTRKKVTVDHSCVSELAFTDNIVHNNRFSCMSGPGIDCLSAQILNSEPCSRPSCLESIGDISQFTAMNRDDGEKLINGRELQLLHPSMSQEDADSTRNMDEKMEKYELASRMVHGSKGRDKDKGVVAKSKAGKKLLLKSVAGGMTLFGAFFVILHLRSKGMDNIRPKNIQGRTAQLQKQKPSQDRLQKSKAAGIYPSERLKLQD